jgi:hypothetical protein
MLPSQSATERRHRDSRMAGALGGLSDRKHLIRDTSAANACTRLRQWGQFVTSTARQIEHPEIMIGALLIVGLTAIEAWRCLMRDNVPPSKQLAPRVGSTAEADRPSGTAAFGRGLRGCTTMDGTLRRHLAASNLCATSATASSYPPIPQPGPPSALPLSTAALPTAVGKNMVRSWVMVGANSRSR